MSLRAMLWALEDAPVDDAQTLLVLIALAERADEHGRAAYPAKGWLAQRGRCSLRTVQRHLNALRLAGLITEGDQRLVASFRPDRRPVVYDLALHITRGDSVTPQGIASGESRQVPTGSHARYERGDTGVSQTVPTPTVKPSIEPKADAAASSAALFDVEPNPEPDTDVADPATVLARWWWERQNPRPAGQGAWFSALRAIKAVLSAGHEPSAVGQALKVLAPPLSIPRLEIALNGQRPTRVAETRADHWAAGGQFMDTPER